MSQGFAKPRTHVTVTGGGEAAGLHGATHHDGGTDELDPVNFASGSQPGNRILETDGAGGFQYIATPGGGSGGLDVTWVSTTPYTITAEGIYVVSSASGVMTVNLPALSGVGATGYRVVVKRVGANYVDVDVNSGDEYEPGGVTSKRLFTDGSAVSIVAHSSGSYWYELGFYGGVLPS